MARKSIQVRIDEKLKTAVEHIFKQCGIDTPTAVRMFFTKVAITGGIPFNVRNDSYYHYSPKEMKEIEEAYEESLDEKNLSPPFDSIDDAIAYLNDENDS